MANRSLEQPNWVIWRAVSKAKVWQAIALSLDIEPTSFRRVSLETAENLDTWARLGGARARTYLPIAEGALLLDPQFAAEFSQRVSAALCELGALRAEPKESSDGVETPDVLISLSALANWIVPLGWWVPPDFAAFAQLGGIEAGNVSDGVPKAFQILLPHGTPYVMVEDIPILIALALHPTPRDYSGVVVQTVALQRARTREQHDMYLRQALRNGELTVHSQSSLMGLPAEAIPVSVVLLRDLVEYVSAFNIRVLLDFVKITEIIPPLADQLVNAHVEAWERDARSNELRRGVAVAFARLHLQQIVKGKVDAGVVSSINGGPAHEEFLEGAAWGVNRADAEQLRRSLPSDLPSWL